MAAIVVLMAVVLISYTIVTVAATMLELTGLDRDTSRFQALSAFSGTGFTTRQAELVVRHPARRRVITTLMVLGNAGTASLVASLIGSFSTSQGQLGLLRNVGLLALFVAASVLLARRFGQSFGDRIRRLLMPRLTSDAVATEELLTYRAGWGISRVMIPEGSVIAGKKLRTSNLRDRHLQVLAVEVGPDVFPLPEPDWRLEAGQNVVVYGDLKAVQAAFAPPEDEDEP